MYDRSFLLHCRNSPLVKSSPPLPIIHGVTSLELETTCDHQLAAEQTDHPHSQSPTLLKVKAVHGMITEERLDRPNVAYFELSVKGLIS